MWFFGRNLDWELVGQSLRTANPWYLALAILIVCLGYVLRAVRWAVLLRPMTETSLRELFATTTVGFAAIFLVGRAGEIVRPMWLPMRDRRVRPSAAAVTIGLERVFDLVSLIAFFSISLMWFTGRPGHEQQYASIKLVGNLMLAAAITFVVLLVIYHFYVDTFIALADRILTKLRIPLRFRKLILSLMRQLGVSLNILRSGPDIFLASFWTVALWFAISIPTFLIVRAFGVDLSFVDSIFVMGVASMGTLVPTPGGAAGAFHAATAGSLILLGIDNEVAAAISIVMHLIYFAPAVFFGLYYFLHGDISFERFRGLLSGEKPSKRSNPILRTRYANKSSGPQ